MSVCLRHTFAVWTLFQDPLPSFLCRRAPFFSHTRNSHSLQLFFLQRCQCHRRAEGYCRGMSEHLLLPALLICREQQIVQTAQVLFKANPDGLCNPELFLARYLMQLSSTPVMLRVMLAEGTPSTRL